MPSSMAAMSTLDVMGLKLINLRPDEAAGSVLLLCLGPEATGEEGDVDRGVGMGSEWEVLLLAMLAAVVVMEGAVWVVSAGASVDAAVPVEAMEVEEKEDAGGTEPCKQRRNRRRWVLIRSEETTGWPDKTVAGEVVGRHRRFIRSPAPRRLCSPMW